MRPTSIVTETKIDIETTLHLSEDGKVLVTTVTKSHNDATYRMLGWLKQAGRDSWVVSSTDGITLLIEETKAEALAQFARRATARAAAWATS